MPHSTTVKPVYIPSYYDDFACTASACPDTCCKGWSIIVDEATAKAWKRLHNPLHIVSGPDHRQVYPAEQITSVTLANGSCRHQLRLEENGRCAMLSEDGLCSVFSQLGEICMPDVCKQFPRNRIDGDAACQKYVSVRCPAVLDLLWASDTFCYKVKPQGFLPDFPARGLLDLFLSIGNHRSLNSASFLNLLFYALYQIHSDLSMYIPYAFDGYRDFGQETITADSIKKVAAFADTFLKEHSAPAKCGQPPFETYHEMLATLTEPFLDNPVFGKDFSDCLEASYEFIENKLTDNKLADNEAEGKLTEENAVFFLSPEADRKLKLVLEEQLFSSIFTVQAADYETTLLSLQWLIVQYVTIRYMLFLDARKGKTIDETQLRFRISRIFRVTEIADLNKLSFFDSKLRNWMWTLQQAEEMLSQLHPYAKK